MNEITAQEIFDTVVDGLRKQGHTSEDKDGCMYRGPNDAKCAAGILIDQSEYNPNMERGTIAQVLEMNTCPISLRERLLPHLDLIRELQLIHDKENIPLWETRFSSLAERFNLIYAPITKKNC